MSNETCRDIEVIRQRREKLQKASRSLKRKFVGLNAIIDRIIANIEAWYVMPEVITRPVIVCLWGMTGVGKTDLIRSLVKCLDFEDRYLEVQMSNKGAANASMVWDNTIQDVMSDLEEDEPNILLLDEIQRFRTVDEHGHGIDDYRFQDVWTLLSDGRFFSNPSAYEEILNILMSDLYNEERREEEKESEATDVTSEGESGSKPRPPKQKKKKPIKKKYHQSYYSAKRLKRALKIEDSIESIMKWSDSEKRGRLYRALEDKELLRGASYKRTLIFVSGNLDEAYKMSKSADDADIDADIFHDFSKRVDMIHIKAALKRRFQPEQISRFGNVHVIYPSLSRKSYKQIIHRYTKAICDKVKKSHAVTIKVDDSVENFIYRNGVFPAQGVRPVLSTIASYVENIIPFFLVRAYELKESRMTMLYAQKKMIAHIGTSIEEKKLEGDLDRIKEDVSDDIRINVSVHEAGHAVIYAILYGVSPTQIVGNSSGKGEYGFMGLHMNHGDKRSILNGIAVCLGGLAAEELVFGDMGRTSGSTQDITYATEHAAQMVRYSGMDEFSARIDPPYDQPAPQTNYDTDATNSKIENLVAKGRQKAQRLLANNKQFFQAISSYLAEYGFMSPEDFSDVAAGFGVDAPVMSTREILHQDYRTQYERFFTSESVHADFDEVDS